MGQWVVQSEDWVVLWSVVNQMETKIICMQTWKQAGLEINFTEMGEWHTQAVVYLQWALHNQEDSLKWLNRMLWVWAQSAITISLLMDTGRDLTIAANHHQEFWIIKILIQTQMKMIKKHLDNYLCRVKTKTFFQGKFFSKKWAVHLWYLSNKKWLKDKI